MVTTTGATEPQGWLKSVVFMGVLAAVVLLPGVSFGAYVTDAVGDVPGAYADIVGIGFTADANNYYFTMDLNGAIRTVGGLPHTNYYILIDSDRRRQHAAREQRDRLCHPGVP